MINLAAIQNLHPEWFAIFEKMELEIVLLAVDCRIGSPIYQVADLGKLLDGHLKERGLGGLDSTAYPGGRHLHFFHIPRGNLGTAVEVLKALLDFHSLLAVSEIYHAEAHDRFCQWWPATAELVVMES